MKPINASARRKAFVTYLLVFLLTLVPICLSIYLYGRVDHAENAFLREKYEEKRKMKGEKSNERIVYYKLESNSNALRRSVVEASDRATTTRQAGNIDSKILEVEAALNEFKVNIVSANKASATDSALVRILEDQVNTLSQLSMIYRNTFEQLEKEKDNLSVLDKDFKRLQQNCN